MRFPRIAILLFLAVATITGPAARAAADELVRFESAATKPSPFRERRAREQGEQLPIPQGAPLIGYLSRPAGRGPFPAVVVMHGCGGLSARLKNDVAAQLVSWGYVALVVDSFATRPVKNTCARPSSTDRVYDAYGALDFLSKDSAVDPKRVVLMGFSAGAGATLEATKVDGDEQIVDRKFKAAIAYYPTCRPTEGGATVPTLIMVGELDDWAPAERCRARVSHLGGDGPAIQLDVFPGAHHAFDVPQAGRRYYGHWLQYDDNATVRATADVQAFLDKFLRR
jgi:dienelactone hydrolase